MRQEKTATKPDKSRLTTPLSTAQSPRTEPQQEKKSGNRRATMDPCRIRSYLQVACAGLGFEIGEIWWTANEHGSSTLAAIEERPTESVTDHNGAIVPANKSEKKLRFVQLYTSKSYANRRSMLVTPPDDDEDEDHVHCPHDHNHDHECTAADLEKHKLSPRLVDAISQTAQVVWANTLKQEGLTGRSDIPLHTAVGMPVALDADGNMCVVVMFSPNNIPNTDEAMEYLQLISRSATSSNIPCLMPAFERTDNIQHVPTSGSKSAIRGHIMPQETSSFGEGVTAKFVSIEDADSNGASKSHDLASAPKDCFGIPMLPTFAELGDNTTHTVPPGNHIQNGRASPAFEEVFDEASYGVWHTIMQDRPPIASSPSPSHYHVEEDPVDIPVENGLPVGLNEGVPNPAEDYNIDPKSLVTTNKRTMDPKRKERLDEFCSAFLGMSVFDIADVWIPAGPERPDCLSHVTSITSSNQSNALMDFKRVSGYTLVKFWSGAVGRAYSSGNPVWSCNPDVYIDKGRSQVFEKANIMTAFAVPIQSGKRATPVGVVCFYSMIQTGSVPFVLRFVQQALHLLWSGLEKVEPHKSVGQEMWQDVGPADLGEMAADVEMQHHFMSKKRPHHTISSQPAPEYVAPDPTTAPLSAQFKVIDFHRDDPAAAPAQTNFHFSTVANHNPPSSPFFTTIEEEKREEIPELINFHRFQQEQPPERRVSVQAMQAFQNHIKDAVRQVGAALPFTHSHIATTADGSKRAHVAHPTSTVSNLQPQTQRKQRKPTPAPLAMPLALPTHVVKVDHHVHRRTSNDHAPPIHMQNASPQNTRNLVLTPAPSPTYVPPPSPAPAPQFTQHNPVHTLPAPSPPAPAPSRLSQNLLSQGMLQNIANQQYQFASASTAQPPASTPQYAAPVAPTPAGMTSAVHCTASAPYVPQQQPPQQTYCMPASSNYPMPDAARSTPPMATTSTAPSAACKGKVCRIQGCGEGAVARRPYCARHSGNRLCEHEGCTKCAQGSTRFCIAHGGGRRCTFAGCDKGARDKFFCAAHGGGKRCKFDGCNKSAVGGSSLCTAHGGGRRCAVDGCDKSAQSSTKFCVKHGGGKKCCFEGCEKVARGRTQYCAAHGGGVRCKLDGCNRVAIGKMQLCRAHGGGSKGRPKNAAATMSLASQHSLSLSAMDAYMPSMDGTGIYPGNAVPLQAFPPPSPPTATIGRAV
ncbi:expressed unknown protein [Seminavis robusta]|uniref:WRKY19-like zinc finger domain-containing protein n=1 Tax=Seminavis robusta TaxID=568900 RepID=A0A9N8D9N9_9STRA|nr:expressed unknown protein [Seminavis robusta]|eukprot:Sro9_g007370.1 n/a (1198) ;mRNA; r:126525-130565